MRMTDLDDNLEIVNIYSSSPDAGLYCIRASGSDLEGSITAISGGALFGDIAFTARRSVAGTIVAGELAHWLVWSHDSIDMHILKNGVEVAYDFSYSEPHLPCTAENNWYIGDPGPGPWNGAVYDGNPAVGFITGLGAPFRGTLANMGCWHGQGAHTIADMWPGLVAGCSPLLYASRLEGSTAWTGLLFNAPLFGDDPNGEINTYSGDVATIIGTGSLGHEDHPVTYWPQPLEIEN
jgi:hypothetical protein